MFLVVEQPVLVVCYLISTAKSVMFRRLAKLQVLVVAVLAFVGILRLLSTAGHKLQMLNVEQRYSSHLDFWDVLNRSYVDQHVPQPWIGSYQCKDVICSEFLHKHDWFEVNKVLTVLRKKDRLLKISPSCHFMNGTSRGSVVLLSFPGSGNTWLRGLLEKATGVCTGEGIYAHSLK